MIDVKYIKKISINQNTANFIIIRTLSRCSGPIVAFFFRSAFTTTSLARFSREWYWKFERCYKNKSTQTLYIHKCRCYMFLSTYWPTNVEQRHELTHQLTFSCRFGVSKSNCINACQRWIRPQPLAGQQLVWQFNDRSRRLWMHLRISNSIDDAKTNTFRELSQSV